MTKHSNHSDQSISEWCQDRNSRQEPAGVNWNRDHGLALHGLLSLLSYTTQAHLPRGGTSHSGLGLFTSIICFKNCLIVLPTIQPDRGIFSIEVPFSQTAFACVQAIGETKQNKQKQTKNKQQQKTVRCSIDLVELGDTQNMWMKRERNQRYLQKNNPEWTVKLRGKTYTGWVIRWRGMWVSPWV